jgi:hypothetical protein
MAGYIEYGYKHSAPQNLGSIFGSSVTVRFSRTTVFSQLILYLLLLLFVSMTDNTHSSFVLTVFYQYFVRVTLKVSYMGQMQMRTKFSLHILA